MCAKCRNGLQKSRHSVSAPRRPVRAAGEPSPTPAVPSEASPSLATVAAPAVPSRAREKRRRLWELPEGWQCSVVGTCLTLGELRRAAVRLRLDVDVEQLTDYELHGFFVHEAKSDSRVARLLQKMLDGTHEGTVRRFSRCRDMTELARAWDEAIEKGDVAGAYWAAMSHPCLEQPLETRFFGEIHMMSHLAGAAQRGDRRDVAVLARARDDLTERLRRAEVDRHEAITKRDAEIERLGRALAEAERAARTAEAEAARLVTLTDPIEIARGKRASDEADARIAALTRDVEDKARLVATGSEVQRRLQDENRSLLMELARTERALQTVMPEDEDAKAEIRVDLAGRRILYVGGRKSTISHARRIVERCNGCLLHHDGGLEQSVAELESTLMSADAVVFPVDCVSHNAINCVKRLCERRAMPFRSLRSSGLGSLVDVLGELAS